VTIFALAVAVYELLQLIGWQSPLSDLQVSAVLVIALTAVFAYIFFETRKAPEPRSDRPPVAALPTGEGP